MSAARKRSPKSSPSTRSSSELVQQITHVEGVTYQLRYTKCGKAACKKGCRSGTPSHGPYWVAFSWNPKTGNTRAHYVGKELPRVDELLDRPEMNQ